MQFLQERIDRGERQVELARRLLDRVLEFAEEANLMLLLKRAEAEGANFMAWWKLHWRGGGVDIWAEPTNFNLFITMPAEAKEWVRTMLPNLPLFKSYHVTTKDEKPILNEDWGWQGESDCRERDELTIRFQRPTFEGEEVGNCKVTASQGIPLPARETWAVSCEMEQPA